MSPYRPPHGLFWSCSRGITSGSVAMPLGAPVLLVAGVGVRGGAALSRRLRGGGRGRRVLLGSRGGDHVPGAAEALDAVAVGLTLAAVLSEHVERVAAERHLVEAVA